MTSIQREIEWNTEGSNEFNVERGSVILTKTIINLEFWEH